MTRFVSLFLVVLIGLFGCATPPKKVEDPSFALHRQCEAYIDDLTPYTTAMVLRNDVTGWELSWEELNRGAFEKGPLRFVSEKDFLASVAGIAKEMGKKVLLVRFEGGKFGVKVIVAKIGEIGAHALVTYHGEPCGVWPVHRIEPGRISIGETTTPVEVLIRKHWRLRWL